MTEDNSAPWQLHDGPLTGVRVLDLSRILSGPFCTMILADLGADVIKVEDAGLGDDTRGWGPPFQGEDAAYFHSVNRNKRSVAVDLKVVECRDLIRELASQADVIVENFRPGTVDRLGLGYEQVRVQNPGIVYASISGYGQTGPWREQPGYDAIAQAMSGVMSVTGLADGPPVRSGISPADLTAGMWACMGILAALRQKEATGEGQQVDVSLFDGQVACLTYVAAGYFATGVTPRRYGTAHPTIVPYQAFPTADREIMIAAGNDGLWQRLAKAIGIEELLSDPRFRANKDRVAHRDVLVPLIEEALRRRSADHWTEILALQGVPAGPVNSVDQALAHPQLAARGMIADVIHSEAGVMRVLGSPIKLSATGPTIRSAAPGHGQDTDEVLRSLGATPALVDSLRARGALG